MKKQKNIAGQQFLDEVRELDKLIKTLKSQIELEESMLMNTSVRYKDIQVQSFGSRNMLEEKVPEIADLINKLEKYIKDLTGKKDLAITTIRELKPRRQTVLLCYYIQGKTLEQTAKELGKSYKWTWDEMQTAIIDFSKKFEKSMKSI